MTGRAKLIRRGSLRELLTHVLLDVLQNHTWDDECNQREYIVEQLALALDEALERLCEEAAETASGDGFATDEKAQTRWLERLHALFIEGFARAKPKEREHPRHPKFPISPLSEEDGPTFFINDYKGKNYCPECAEEAFGADWPSGESSKLDGSDPGDCCWETFTTGWTGPVVCSVCKMSIPVYVDGKEGEQ